MNGKALDKKVGQLMVCGFYGTTPPEEIKELIRDYHIGGIILFTRNMGSTSEVLRLTTELQLLAKESGYKHPLLICVDQENGIVRRLGVGATVFPGSMLLSATGNAENAYLIGAATGRELKALGINWNLAPVIDVNNNPNNPVIGVRSYGEDPVTVTTFARAAIRGMREAGTITTLKHFPGHGDTSVDSHLDLPVITHDMERLEALELVPFKQLIGEGTDSIMTAHVYFPALEKKQGVPATLSKSIVTGLLREKLGYNGVITTDCMEMNAIKNTIGTVQGSVEAVKAGVDLVMISHSYALQKGSIEAIAERVYTGEIDEALIDQAILRIETLCNKYLSWEDLPLDLNSLEVSSQVGGIDNKMLAQNIYRQGVTLIENASNIIPLRLSSTPSMSMSMSQSQSQLQALSSSSLESSLETSSLSQRLQSRLQSQSQAQAEVQVQSLRSCENQKTLVIEPFSPSLVMVEDVEYSNLSLGHAVKEIDVLADLEIMQKPLKQEEVESLLTRAKEYGNIIIGTLSLKQQDLEVGLIKALMDMGKSVIVVAMKSPYDIAYIPEGCAYIATYEYTYPALCMAAKTIYGVEKVTGIMPVSIPKLVK